MKSSLTSNPRTRRIYGALASLLLLGAFVSLAWAMQNSIAGTPSTRPAQDPSSAPPSRVFTLPNLARQNPGAQNSGVRGPLLPPPPNGKTVSPGGVLPLPSAPSLQGNPQLTALWQKGLQAQQIGKLAEAAEAYKALLRAKPDAFPAHVNLAFVLLQQHQEKTAVWHLRRAIALAPREMQPRLALAQTFTQLKEPRDALAQWTQIATMAKTQNNNPLYVQAVMTAGALALEQLKDLPTAETWLRRANDALKGKDPRIIMSLAQVLSTQKKSGAAIQILRAGAQQFPKMVEIQTALAQAQWAAKDFAGAIATLKNLETQVPASQNNGLALGQIRVMLARAQAQQKQYSQAVATLQNALDGLPKNSPALDSTRAALAQTFAAEGQSLEKEKKLQEAVDAWQKAAQLFPKNPTAYLQRAQIFQKLDKDDDALREYRRALQLIPHEPSALLQAAQLEEKNGDAKQAATDWQNLINARPDYKPAYFGLMRLAAKKNQWSQQLHYMETRAAKTPDQRAIYDAVLLVSEREGKLGEARAWVESLAKKYPAAKAPRAALQSFAVKPQGTPTLSSAGTPAPQPTPISIPLAHATPSPRSTPLVPKTPPSKNPLSEPATSLAPSAALQTRPAASKGSVPKPVQ